MVTRREATAAGVGGPRWTAGWMPYAVAALAAVLVALAGAAGALDDLEGSAVDARFAVRGAEDPPDDVVLVAVDDVTFSELGVQWPFPRRLHARLLNRLRNAGAAVVAYDVQFSEPSDDPEQDAALVRAITRTGNVVLAASEVTEDGDVPVLGGRGNVRAARAEVGSVFLPVDGDGRIRRVGRSADGLPTFAAAAFRRAEGHLPDGDGFAGDGTVPIAFRGPPGTVRRYPFSRVLAGRVPEAAFRDKVVVVGATSPTLHDDYEAATSRPDRMPGAEVQASAIDTLLRDAPLRRAPLVLNALALLLLALAPAVCTSRLRLRDAALAMTGAVLAFAVVAQVLFLAGTIVHVAAPVAAWVLSGGATMALVVARRRLVVVAVAGPSGTGAAGAVAGRADGTAGGAEALLGTELAGFRLESVVGRGGMGVVFRAEHVDLGRKAAVKVMGAHLGADPAFRERFKREARLAAAIEHPNIVPVYAAGERDGHLFLAMRFLDGSDLAALLEQRGNLSPGWTLSIARQVAAALDAAHRRGLVHRDVKPANVLLVDDPAAQDGVPHALLTDFGISREVRGEATVTATGAFVGSVDYAAPEQIEGHDPSPAADVYALGCLVFHALTGRPPFRREHDVATLWAHLNDPVPRASAVLPVLGAGTDAVLERALAKAPAERFPSCARFVAALAEALPATAGPAPAAPAPDATPTQPKGTVVDEWPDR